jgi:uncharacterized protein (DUF433 family)
MPETTTCLDCEESNSPTVVGGNSFISGRDICPEDNGTTTAPMPTTVWSHTPPAGCSGDVTNYDYALEYCCEPIAIPAPKSIVVSACPCWFAAVEIVSLPDVAKGKLTIEGCDVEVGQVLDEQIANLLVYIAVAPGVVATDTFQLRSLYTCGSDTAVVTINMLEKTCTAEEPCSDCSST